MRRLTAAIAIVLLTLAMTVAAGCGSGDETEETVSTLPTPPLEGTTWLLTSYARGGAAATPVLPGSRPTMLLEGAKLSGNGGVNNYFGIYSLDGQNLTITVEGSTQMAGSPEAMLQEQLYLEALADVATYEMAGVELRLLSQSQAVVATYTEMRSLPLTGTTWSLTGYLDAEKQAFSSTITDTEVTAVFADDGTVAGKAGCNEYSGPYTAEGETLTVGALITTKMFCESPAGIMDQEAAYLAGLQNAATYTAEGTTLTVLDAEGTRLLTYEATQMAE